MPAPLGPFDVVVQRDLMASMRDGVRLAADLYRPAREGCVVEEPLPVLLERTPYDKGDRERSQRDRLFASYGYAVVTQDCRGCYASEGELDFLVQEPRDGYDTVEWAARQPWCNGRVGMFGTSYLGWTQSAAATQNPPHLACIVPSMSGWNAHSSSVRQGGAVELRFIAWAFWHAALNSNSKLKGDPWVGRALNGVDARDWLRRLPLRRGASPLGLAPNYERWAMELLNHSDYDEYWMQAGFNIEGHVADHSDVPVYVVGGWYDSYPRATFEMFEGLSGAKRGPVKVIVGPWYHGTYTPELSYAGDVEFGPEAALGSFDELHLRWFDRWLRGEENGAEADGPIRIFVMGGGDGRKTAEGRLFHGGAWRTEREWPPARARFTPHYLHADLSLSPEPPAGSSEPTRYVYDPAHPVPTIGGSFSSLDYLAPLPAGVDPGSLPGVLRRRPVTPNGGFDQVEGPAFFGSGEAHMPLASRDDVVVFQTPPLEADVEVTGPIEVKLWASSSAVDTDFCAKLVDVYPPSVDYPMGYALNICDGIIRAVYRESWERAEPLTPGRVYELAIRLYPTSNVFARGHRIRLDVSSSNFPRFDVNPNTGAAPGQRRGTVAAENAIYHDAEHPSHVVLPVVPR